MTMLTTPDLARLINVGDIQFIPVLRLPPLLGDAEYQAEKLGITVSYRLTVVDGKFGVLFTRRADRSKGQLRQEDR